MANHWILKLDLSYIYFVGILLFFGLHFYPNYPNCNTLVYILKLRYPHYIFNIHISMILGTFEIFIIIIFILAFIYQKNSSYFVKIFIILLHKVRCKGYRFRWYFSSNIILRNKYFITLKYIHLNVKYDSILW